MLLSCYTFMRNEVSSLLWAFSHALRSCHSAAAAAAKQTSLNAVNMLMCFPGGASGKELTCQCGRCKRHGFNPWLRKIPWRRAWQPTPVFLPGESHGQRSLEGCSPQSLPGQTQLKRLSTDTQICLCVSHTQWAVSSSSQGTTSYILFILASLLHDSTWQMVGTS